MRDNIKYRSGNTQVTQYLNTLTSLIDDSTWKTLNELLKNTENKLETLFNFCAEIFIDKYVERDRFYKLQKLLKFNQVHIFTLNTAVDAVTALFENVFEVHDIKNRIHFTRKEFSDTLNGSTLFLDLLKQKPDLSEIGMFNAHKAYEIRKFIGTDNTGVVLDDDNRIRDLVAGQNENDPITKVLRENAPLRSISVPRKDSRGNTISMDKMDALVFPVESEFGIMAEEIQRLVDKLTNTTHIRIAIDFDGTIIKDKYVKSGSDEDRAESIIRLTFTELLADIAKHIG